MNIVVLGAGLVGRPMALDLARDPDLTVAVVDNRPEALATLAATDERIETVRADLSSARTVSGLATEYDLVLSAVPGHMGFRTLEAVIAAGTHVVDIAFSPEDPFALDERAKDQGVIAVVDCGVAPGMSNVLIGHAVQRLDRVDRVLIYVGGLPEVREWPFEYKAGFSPIDVIAEYVRPARFVENGQLTVRPALTDPELVDFPNIGTLEAFNTDGLRTLARTIDAPNLKEKTLRYPGHADKMLMLRETGFFDTEPVEIEGSAVRPIDLTAKLLFPKWKLEPGDVDITVVRVMVDGDAGGRRTRYTFELFDRYDEASGIHSMARTTGYTATVTARLLASGLYTAPGITPPEYLGRHDACVRFLLDGLEQRGVVYTQTVEHPSKVGRG
jgi:saccharopine dehydrogenase-like NADP-dependent oxidoreductase